MKKVAVVLSGCGFKDGSEITEAVSALINLTQEGAAYECFAPDKTFEATNHKTGGKDGTRNILVEAARIARGNVRPLKDLKPADFDAVIFPGGFGAALHLCTWGNKGAACDVLPEARQAVEGFYKAKKPIGAICIAPALIARVLGSQKVKVTIGNDEETAQEIIKTGAAHEKCDVTKDVVDRAAKVVTTPAYMYGQAKPHEVYLGVKALVKDVLSLA